MIKIITIIILYIILTISFMFCTKWGKIKKIIESLLLGWLMMIILVIGFILYKLFGIKNVISDFDGDQK